MKKEQLSQAINDVDLCFVEEADSFSVKKRQRIFQKTKWVVAAACAVFVVLAGKPVLNYATGLYDSVMNYFEGETELYMEQILSPVTSVSNEELKLCVEGVIADEHQCYIIVSFTGLTDEMEARLLRGDLDEQELFEQYVVLANGEHSEWIASGSRTHTTEGIDGKRKAVSMIPGTHATYVITYLFDDYDLSEIQKVGFAYEGLFVEVNVRDSVTPCYRLESSDDRANLTDVYVSSMGYGFTYHFEQPISENNIDRMDVFFEVNLIKADGTIMTREEMADIGMVENCGYSTGDTECDVRGYWETGHMPRIINLEEYCGLQVNGVNYYFVK